jgi:hypothetical protein
MNIEILDGKLPVRILVLHPDHANMGCAANRNYLCQRKTRRITFSLSSHLTTEPFEPRGFCEKEMGAFARLTDSNPYLEKVESRMLMKAMEQYIAI